MSDTVRHNTRPLPGRLDDVEWLADSDETLTGAARRLNITRDALYRWLRDHGQHVILQRLTQREGTFKDDRPRGLRHVVMASGDPDGPPSIDVVVSADLCEYAGITYRQLDYWTRTDILKPYTQPTPGSGNTRLYSRDEAQVALTIRHLVDAGLDPRHAGTLARQLLAGETPRVGAFRLVPIPGDAA